MKTVLRGYGSNMTTIERQQARIELAAITRTQGVARRPLPPRDLQAQSGPRGILLTWKFSQGYVLDIQRWRVYKDDENTLYAEINDRGTRQCFIETTAGSTPPVVNLFVSSVNNLGVESQKVQAQGTAAVEAGAPSMPSTPPGYTSEASGGGSTNTNYGGRSTNGARQQL